MKFLKKHWFKLISSLLILALAVYVLCVGIKKANDYEIYSKPQVETKIYTIWEVDTFEGGSLSRINYLKHLARETEKKNAGVLFMVKQIELENFAAELSEGAPDIISFGYGLGGQVFEFLQPLDLTYDVRDELVESGSFNGKVYCLPYIVSGYAMITHGTLTNEFHCGQTGYTFPQNAYAPYKLEPAKEESQYEAYKSFVYNNSTTLLGTGRDVVRVDNLNNLGRASAMITPIDYYSDLVQYLGLVNADEICKQFLKDALSNKSQNTLVDYKLYSAKYGKIYTSGIYSDMEDAILNAEIPNVFSY